MTLKYIMDRKNMKISKQRLNLLLKKGLISNSDFDNYKDSTHRNPPQKVVPENPKDCVFTPLPNSRNREIIKEWKNLTGSDFIFISFMSDPIGSTFYSQRAQAIIEKVKKLGYDFIIRQYGSDRMYYQNCCFKPTFINNVFKETGKNLLWMDIDTDLKDDISGFLDTSVPYDIGVSTYNGDINGFLASPLFLRNTDITRDLINRWEEHCTDRIEKGICELDHDALKHSILPLFQKKISIKLNDENFHRGIFLDNINSPSPHKRRIYKEMEKINADRPFLLNNNNFIIV